MLRDAARLSQRCPPIARYGVFVRKVWVSIKFLSAKFGFTPPPPPPEKGPEEWGKTVQINRKSSKLTHFRGGGGNAILWTKRVYGHLGVSDFGVSTWPLGCDTPSPFSERAIPPSAILSRKGIALYGGVSRIGPLGKFVCTQPICITISVNGKSCFSNRALVKATFEAPKSFKKCFSGLTIGLY